MILTKRDNLIISLLQQQDFCFYKDIEKNFFPSSATASLRLKKLKQKGLISIEPIHSPSFNKIMDQASMPFIGNNKKVVYLNNKFKIIKRKTSNWKIKIAKDKPLGKIQKRIEDFFWRASLGARYSSGVESKLASDIEKLTKY